MPFALASACDTPNSAAILAGIYDIAMNQTLTTGITFAGGKQWAVPTTDEIKAAGYPFFVVLQPTSAGSSEGSILQPGRGICRNPFGQWEPVWDYRCYAIYPKRDVTKPATFSTPEAMKDALIRAFMMFYTLEDTCQTCEVLEPEVITLKPVGGSSMYSAATMVVRAFEHLTITY